MPDTAIAPQGRARELTSQVALISFNGLGS